MIVVLDTSVWISAMEFGGVPELAVERVLTRDALAISSFIQAEVIRILVCKFDRQEQAVREDLRAMWGRALRVDVHGLLSGVCRDPNDDAILETALNAHAQLLVAGDKDLLTLKSFQGIAIVTPAEYLCVGS